MYNSFLSRKVPFSTVQLHLIHLHSKESKQFKARERSSSVYPSNLSYFARMWYKEELRKF